MKCTHEIKTWACTGTLMKGVQETSEADGEEGATLVANLGLRGCPEGRHCVCRRREPNATSFDAKRGVFVSGRARALRSFTVFLKRDRTARGLSIL
ncbi:hypothetical protein CKO51_14800 [Rhodopirellula sp. SM50]|nr:hypothetical protein CKO51_14800 [Rhodopirellula sp. SM50]